MAQFATFYYQEGSAARQYEAVALPTREDLAREIEEEKARIKRERIRAHRKVKRESRRATVLFAAGVALCGCFFATYVSLQNRITTSMSHIAKLETQISDLKTENAAAKSRIATTSNLSNVRDVAMKDLGMVYANSDQIVYYSIEEEDFMSQYDEIE